MALCRHTPSYSVEARYLSKRTPLGGEMPQKWNTTAATAWKLFCVCLKKSLYT
jgi:hypothetical protein